MATLLKETFRAALCKLLILQLKDHSQLRIQTDRLQRNALIWIHRRQLPGNSKLLSDMYRATSLLMA